MIRNLRNRSSREIRHGSLSLVRVFENKQGRMWGNRFDFFHDVQFGYAPRSRREIMPDEIDARRTVLCKLGCWLCFIIVLSSRIIVQILFFSVLVIVVVATFEFRVFALVERVFQIVIFGWCVWRIQRMFIALENDLLTIAINRSFVRTVKGKAMSSEGREQLSLSYASALLTSAFNLFSASNLASSRFFCSSSSAAVELSASARLSTATRIHRTRA